MRWLAVALVLVPAFLLSLLGLSAIATVGDAGRGLANWKQQAFFLPLGLIGATIAACVPLHLLRKHAALLGFLVAGLLVLLLLPGVPESLVRPRNGARRWISLVVFDLQPSELARVAWCLLMARLLYAGEALSLIHI